MTPQQEQHLQQIQQEFGSALSLKYQAGQKEHGGNLWERNCLEEAMKETVDLIAYIHTALNNQKTATAILSRMLMSGTLDGENTHHVQSVIKLLRGI